MTLIAPTDPRLQWIGRTHVDADGRVWLGYPGITLRLHATGKSALLRVHALSDTCRFSTGQIPEGDTSIPLLVNQPTKLMRLNEAWQGLVRIDGLELDGKLQEPPALPRRKLLFIGDSITAAPEAFGDVLGERLGAQVHRVAYGGRGLWRDWQGLDSTQQNNAPIFFERTLPDDPKALWDHDKFQPDTVVVGLGTNDLNLGLPDEEAWVMLYTSFLDRIREVHPRAKLLITNSPMHRPGSDHDGYLRRILPQIAAQSGASVAWVNYQPGDANDSHPTPDQHRKIADDLEPYLK
jgi:lysophospholipase L1-like esterase